jgi:hypothetical protein
VGGIGDPAGGVTVGRLGESEREDDGGKPGRVYCGLLGP